MDSNKDEMGEFLKLEKRLDKVKKYREGNVERLKKLKDDIKGVRRQMDRVITEQNSALHKIITGRNKAK